jgi:uncharacterized alpha-E superfamily protein
MPINIERMDSTVRAVDGSTLISPQVMQQIIEMVLRAVEQDSAHQRRVQAERRVTPGVVYEQEEEER